jgi:GDP-mannose 6-dehydrogenase
MDISIFGLGYVGTVCAACLSHHGHRVIGCDVQDHKVNAINNGQSPIEEPGLAELIRQGYDTGLLRATKDPTDAVSNSTLSLVCVGTPSETDGGINLSYLNTVCEQIGKAVRNLKREHTIVIRSTVLPKALDTTIIPMLIDAVGPQWGEYLHLCVNPEFLREGTAIADFENPPMVVIGENKPNDGDVLIQLYQELHSPVFRLGLKEAAMVKYACNIFHALKIVFGNEIGMLCQAFGINSHQVMDVFCQDKQLNISHRYLKPGYAYGGSCLPKDLRAMLNFSRLYNIETAMLAAIQRSNQLHIEKAVQTVLSTGARKVGVFGLSFKDNTDDLRESPTVEIIERLIGKGLVIRIHDEDVATSRIFGSNLNFIRQHLPHIATLMVASREEIFRDSELVLVAKPSKLYKDVPEHLSANQTLVDLVRFFNPTEVTICKYISLVG